MSFDSRIRAAAGLLGAGAALTAAVAGGPASAEGPSTRDIENLAAGMASSQDFSYQTPPGAVRMPGWSSLDVWAGDACESRFMSGINFESSAHQRSVSGYVDYVCTELEAGKVTTEEQCLQQTAAETDRRFPERENLSEKLKPLIDWSCREIGEQTLIQGVLKPNAD